MPQVYKENLVETILPSIQSVMTAVLHYKKMGGEANLYICDDGLQVRGTTCSKTTLWDTSCCCTRMHIQSRLSGSVRVRHDTIRIIE